LTPPSEPKIKPVAVKESKGKAGNIYPTKTLHHIKAPSLPKVKLARTKGVPILKVKGCLYAITEHYVSRDKHRFCNHAKKDGSSYCDEHHSRVYQKQDVGPRPRKPIYAYR
jgi:hypothetical protein